MAKQVTFDQEARERLTTGVKKLAEAVKTTLGPRGYYAVLDRSWGEPKVTMDGASVAEEVELKDPVENVGARVLRSAAEKTSDEAGDGSTTATVIGEAVYLAGVKAVTAGNNPMLVARGIRRAADQVAEFLEKAGKKVKGRDQIRAAATIAANGDPEIGKIIADAMDKVGEQGIITVEEGKLLETTLEVVEGMEFDRGFLSPHFVTDEEHLVAELEDPYILIMEEKVSNLNQILPVLELVLRQKKPFFLIAEDVESEALATLVVNHMKKNLQCCAVKAPGYGERRKALLGDIAVKTGGTAIYKDLGLKPESITLDMLGRARKIKVTSEKTTIIGGRGRQKDIEDRARQIRLELETTDSNYDREKLQERLASLVGGVAQINVGGGTESEVKEKKGRVESAVEATKAAVETGILPGGGVPLLNAQKVLDELKVSDPEEKVGVDIVRQALEAPIRQLALNAGYEPAWVIRQVRKARSGWGFDLVRGELVDMFEAGIIDPVKVVKTAFLNGVSAALMLLTTEAVVTEIPKKPKKKKKRKARGGGPEEFEDMEDWE